jgi:hypothetical protein
MKKKNFKSVIINDVSDKTFDELKSSIKSKIDSLERTDLFNLSILKNGQWESFALYTNIDDIFKICLALNYVITEHKKEIISILEGENE